jgi:hypothetical protein
MRFAEDHDIGTVILTVIITMMLAGMVYLYNSHDGVKTAFLSTFERTVPTIVPSGPQL